MSLTKYDWPGNVRELENMIGRAMINMRPQETIIGVEHLPLLECERIGQMILGGGGGPVQPLSQVIAEAEKAAIRRALHEAGGNREQAAQLLGHSVSGTCITR